MEITKPILHTGVLKHDIGNISYNQNFLKKLADSKDVNVQLNSHEGEKITKVTNLEYKNGALYATMDVPEKYLADEIAFSADIVPSKYDKIDSNTFEPVEGILDNVVFVNDGTKVRDTRTITRLQNLDDKGELNMAGEENIAEKYGALKTKYATQETELANVRNDLEKANNEKETAQQTLQDKENEITELKKQLGVYKQSEEDEKDEIIKSLVEKEDDPLVEGYKEMDIKYLRLLANKPASKSTPPKGAGTKTTEQKDGSEEEENKEEEFDYLARKKALGIR